MRRHRVGSLTRPTEHAHTHTHKGRSVQGDLQSDSATHTQTCANNALARDSPKFTQQTVLVVMRVGSRIVRSAHTNGAMVTEMNSLYLLVGAVRVNARAAMAARIRQALFHIVAARRSLEALRAAALVLSHRQRCAVAAIVTWRRCAHVLLLAVFACLPGNSKWSDSSRPQLDARAHTNKAHLPV